MNRICCACLILALFPGCKPLRTLLAPENDTVSQREQTDNAGEEETYMIKEHKSGEWSPELSNSEKQTLFKIVEDTLNWCVNGSSEPFSFDQYTLTDKMKKDTATFVTLKINGMLRGCIGSLIPADPMYKSVHENAVLASMRDHRFRPVAPRELPTIEVYISILSPIVPIDSLEKFKIGEHGIILTKGRARAVYLPEVAVEQKWNKDQTLSSLSEKAGLDGDSWRQGASFQVFSSVVLSK
ncbi:MAG: AmmeMemoRadiSam system protein A [Lentisphaerae bacterium]|nr:AmmeMemoRadiSam system protein A [Lentisphaerota bacterium]